MKAFLAADFSPMVFDKIEPYVGVIRDKKILAITTAAVGEGFLPDVDKNITPFTTRGAVVECYDVAGQPRNVVADRIKDADIILMCGGNTFYLLEHLGACDFQALLMADGMHDKVYIGSSAGSVVAGLDVWFMNLMDDPSRATLTDYRGFGWIDFLFLPHWQTPVSATMARAADDIIVAHDGPVPLLALEDHQVVYLPDVQKRTMFIL
jgi:dipeptidase E